MGCAIGRFEELIRIQSSSDHCLPIKRSIITEFRIRTPHIDGRKMKNLERPLKNQIEHRLEYRMEHLLKQQMEQRMEYRLMPGNE